jgi:hypothetical protein
LLVSLLAPYLDAQSTIRLMSANGALSRSQDVCLDTTSKICIDHFWAFISVRWSSTFSVGQVWLSDGLKGGENKLVWRSPAYGALGTWTRVSQPNLRACGPPPAGPRSELGAGQAPCVRVILSRGRSKGALVSSCPLPFRSHDVSIRELLGIGWGFREAD